MGEMLKATERSKGHNKYQKVASIDPIPATLSDMGITKIESAKAQKIAAMPEEVFEDVLTGEVSFNRLDRMAAKKRLQGAMVQRGATEQ